MARKRKVHKNPLNRPVGRFAERHSVFRPRLALPFIAIVGSQIATQRRVRRASDLLSFSDFDHLLESHQSTV